MRTLSQIDKPPIEVYVELLDEGSEAWRPTQAVELRNGLFQLLPTAGYDPEDESWAFLPGEIVRLEKRLSEKGERQFVRHPDLSVVRIQVESLGKDVMLYDAYARELGGGLYEVLPTPHYDPEQQHWKFLPGSTVRLEERDFPYGMRLFAIKP